MKNMVKVDVTKIVKYVSVAAVLIVAIVFGTKCAQKGMLLCTKNCEG